MEASRLEKFLQMDFLGTFFILTATVSYILAMEWGGVTKSWSSADVVAILAIFAVFLTLFIMNEWLQAERAQLAPSKLADRTLWAVCLVIVL